MGFSKLQSSGMLAEEDYEVSDYVLHLISCSEHQYPNFYESWLLLEVMWYTGRFANLRGILLLNLCIWMILGLIEVLIYYCLCVFSHYYLTLDFTLSIGLMFFLTTHLTSHFPGANFQTEPREWLIETKFECDKCSSECS